jgi:energy-coupling factor transporter ATP-binding protein EcfA2
LKLLSFSLKSSAVAELANVAEPFSVQQDEFALLVMSLINTHAAALLKARTAHALSHGARQHHAVVSATTSRNRHLSTVTQVGGMMMISCMVSCMSS